MIGRIWHGWTTPQNADKYESLLKEEIFSGIAEKKVSGYKGIQLFRRSLDNEEVEFVTIMWFDSWDAVKQFAGDDYERAYVPPAAREVLARFWAFDSVPVAVAVESRSAASVYSGLALSPPVPTPRPHRGGASRRSAGLPGTECRDESAVARAARAGRARGNPSFR